MNNTPNNKPPRRDNLYKKRIYTYYILHTLKIWLNQKFISSYFLQYLFITQWNKKNHNNYKKNPNDKKIRERNN